MKFGIISDTHDNTMNVAKAVDIFTDEKVDYILHAGDIVSPSTAEALANIKNARFIGVFGNCDRDKSATESVVKKHNGDIREFAYDGRIGPINVFITHKPENLDHVAGNCELRLVVFGHTHKKFVHKVDSMLIINPGASDVVILNLEDMSVKEVPLQ